MKKEDPVSDNEKTVDLGLESELEMDFDDALARAEHEKAFAADAVASIAIQVGGKLLLCAHHLRGWIEEEYSGEVQQCYPEHCALCEVEKSDPDMSSLICPERFTRVNLTSFETLARKKTVASSLREVCALLTRARILIERHVPHVGRCVDHCAFIRQIDRALKRAKGETS